MKRVSGMICPSTQMAISTMELTTRYLVFSVVPIGEAPTEKNNAVKKRARKLEKEQARRDGHDDGNGPAVAGGPNRALVQQNRYRQQCGGRKGYCSGNESGDGKG